MSFILKQHFNTICIKIYIGRKMKMESCWMINVFLICKKLYVNIAYEEHFSKQHVLSSATAQAKNNVSELVIKMVGENVNENVHVRLYEVCMKIIELFERVLYNIGIII